ncbi:hypothetical protein ACOMHN_061901 [Nucella lapillus]
MCLFLEGKMCLFLEGKMCLFLEGKMCLFLEGKMCLFLEGKMCLFLEGRKTGAEAVLMEGQLQAEARVWIIGWILAGVTPWSAGLQLQDAEGERTSVMLISFPGELIKTLLSNPMFSLSATSIAIPSR